VVNYSLLGIDWYINQLRYKVNQSDPIDVLWTPEQIEGGKRDFIRFFEKPGVTDQNRYVDLYSLMKDFVGSDDPNNMLPMQDGSMINYFPVKKISVAVDVDLVRQNKTVNPTDSVSSEIRFEIPRNMLLKNDMAVLNIIAANKWKRPIYFTSPFGELGFSQYLRSDGMSYRLVPVQSQNQVNNSWAYEKLMKDFAFGGSDRKGTYYDEENRRHLISIRQSYAEVANSLAGSGQKEEAKKILERLDKNMLTDNMPYGLVSRQNQHNMVSAQLAEAAFRAGDMTLAEKITGALKKDLADQLAYYAYLGDMSVNELYQAIQDIMSNKADNLSNRQKALFIDMRQAYALQEYLKNMESIYKGSAAPALEIPGTINNAADTSPKGK